MALLNFVAFFCLLVCAVSLYACAPPPAGYVGSIVLTLYAALIMHSYVLSLLCSVLQVVALLYYLTSYYPGGTSSVKFLLSMFGSAAGTCFSSCTAMMFGK